MSDERYTTTPTIAGVGPTEVLEIGVRATDGRTFWVDSARIAVELRPIVAEAASQSQFAENAPCSIVAMVSRAVLQIAEGAA